MLKRCLILFVLISGAASWVHAQDPGEGVPVTIGSTCFEEGSTYYLTTSERTPWSVNQISAVPAGFIDPEEWSEFSSFQQRLSQELSESPGTADFAAACTAIWQEFFSDQADVLVTLKRTITKTDDVLQCLSGSWVFESTQNSEDLDVSDWLRIGDQEYDVTNGASAQSFTSQLESLVNNLNSQPGAQNQPDSGQ